MGYKRSNIYGYGGEWIEKFLEKYDLEFVCKESCEQEIMKYEIKKFKNYLENFHDKWISKHNYNVMKNQVANMEEKIYRAKLANANALNSMRERLEEIKHEKEIGFEKQYGNMLEERQLELALQYKGLADENYEKFETRLDEIQRDYNKKLEELNATNEDLKVVNEKWKAMFTKQALANATLTEMIKEYKEG